MLVFSVLITIFFPKYWSFLFLNFFSFVRIAFRNLLNKFIYDPHKYTRVIVYIPINLSRIVRTKLYSKINQFNKIVCSCALTCSVTHKGNVCRQTNETCEVRLYLYLNNKLIVNASMRYPKKIDDHPYFRTFSTVINSCSTLGILSVPYESMRIQGRFLLRVCYVCNEKTNGKKVPMIVYQIQ